MAKALASGGCGPTTDSFKTETELGRIAVWDVPSRKQSTTCRDMPAYVNAVALRSDGGAIAVACGNNLSIRDPRPQLVIFDAKTGEKLQELEVRHSAANCVAFAPDGKSLASGSDKDFRVWKLTNGAYRVSIDVWSVRVARR